MWLCCRNGVERCCAHAGAGERERLGWGCKSLIPVSAPLHKQTCLRGKYIFVIDWIYICFYFHKVENWIFLGEKMNTSLL